MSRASRGSVGRTVAVDIYFVVVACPNTGRATRTGVELTDLAEFAFVGLLPESFDCQHCHESHTWSHKDAWIERHQGSRLHVRAAVAIPKP